MTEPTAAAALAASAVEGLKSFGVTWLILSALVALGVAPLLMAVLGELSKRLDALRMTRTLIAAVFVGLGVWLVSWADGQSHHEVHGMVGFSMGAVSYWLGPMMRGFVGRVVKSK